jgi:hypothetical protein
MILGAIKRVCYSVHTFPNFYNQQQTVFYRTYAKIAKIAEVPRSP